MRRTSALVLLVSALAVACSARPAGPSDPPAPLRLTVTTSQSEVLPGTTAVLTFLLENRGGAPLRLNFSSGCQILPYINRRNAQVVYPEGGTWVCTAVVTELVLQPNGSIFRQVSVRGEGNIRPADVSLPPGEYVAVARLDAVQHRLESAPVSFTIR